MDLWQGLSRSLRSGQVPAVPPNGNRAYGGCQENAADKLRRYLLHLMAWAGLPQAPESRVGKGNDWIRTKAIVVVPEHYEFLPQPMGSPLGPHIQREDSINAW